MKTSLVFVFLMLSVVGSLHAQLSIRIVDIPDSSLIYSPVYVTFALRNEDKKPVLLSVNADPLKGASVRVGAKNTHLTVGDRYFDATKWVKPGDEYYFQFEISRFFQDAGVYEIQAMYRSDGQCRIKQKHGSHLTAVSEKDHIYECYAGSVVSEIRKVNIYYPVDQLDLQVLTEIKTGSGRWRQNIRNFRESAVTVNLAHAFEYLLEKYPDSYYTYAAGIYAAHSSLWGYPFVTLERIMKLNPGHPLADYTRMQWRLSVASKTRDKKFGHVAKGRWTQKTNMKLPNNLEAYARQFEEEISTELGLE